MAIDYTTLIAYIDGLYVDGSLSESDYQAIINYILANGDVESNPRDLIQIRRGNFADLPMLAQGELGFTLDTETLYAGGLNGNVKVKGKDVLVSITDYGAKGDGVTDNSVAIQSAIDYVYGIGGGVVAIPPSDEPFIYSSILVKSNVVLQGFGGVLKLADGVCVDSGVSYYTLSNLGHTFVGYKDLIIDMNKANNPDFLVADAITCVDEGSFVDGCHLYNVVDSGIMFSGVKGGHCSNNLIEDASDLGIYINDGDGTAHYENLVFNNRIKNCGSGIAGKRITQRTIISNNSIEGCTFGITLEQVLAGTYSKNVTIANNRLRNITNSGVILRTSPYCSVIGNRIEFYGNYGIQIEGDTQFSTIMGNVITTDSSHPVVGTYHAGLFVNSRDGIMPSNNIIIGNTVDVQNDSGDTMYGVYMIVLETVTDGGDNNRFDSNIIMSTSQRALRIASDYEGNVFSNNTFDGLTYDLQIESDNNYLIQNKFVNETSVVHPTANDGVVFGLLYNQKLSVNSAAPTAGTWKVGDKVYNSSPAGGGYVGWVCTAAGTPGTWKGFGAIEA